MIEHSPKFLVSEEQATKVPDTRIGQIRANDRQYSTSDTAAAHHVVSANPQSLHYV